jgi:hypothetical protein
MDARTTGRPRRLRPALLGLIAVAAVLLAAAPGALGAAKPQPAPSYSPFFGDLHSHTELSDGDGTPAEAFAQAKSGGADFFAVSDHSSSLSAAEWQQIKDAAAAATDATFVGIPSYEITMGWGHINPYGVPDLPTKKTGNQGGRKDVMSAYYDWLATYPGASAQWNHPTTYSKEFDGFAYYTPKRDEVMNLLEVHNDINYGYYKVTDYDSSYVKALDLGWHVMPTANSDTHSATWITGYQARTVLLADSLTAPGLYAAMRSCRGYATEDKDLRVAFTVNGAVMGTVLTGGTTFQVSATVDDPDAGDVPTKLEIVSDGGVVVAQNDAPQKGVAWTPSLTSSTSKYYFLRVTTLRNVTGGAGWTAWTAPVWTGR